MQVVQSADFMMPPSYPIAPTLPTHGHAIPGHAGTDPQPTTAQNAHPSFSPCGRRWTGAPTPGRMRGAGRIASVSFLPTPLIRPSGTFSHKGRRGSHILKARRFASIVVPGDTLRVIPAKGAKRPQSRDPLAASSSGTARSSPASRNRKLIHPLITSAYPCPVPSAGTPLMTVDVREGMGVPDDAANVAEETGQASRSPRQSPAGKAVRGVDAVCPWALRLETAGCAGAMVHLRRGWEGWKAPDGRSEGRTYYYR